MTSATYCIYLDLQRLETMVIEQRLSGIAESAHLKNQHTSLPPTPVIQPLPIRPQLLNNFTNCLSHLNSQSTNKKGIFTLVGKTELVSVKMV